MKQPRYNLGEFYNQCIEITGNFCNFYDYIEYSYNEEIENSAPKSFTMANPKSGLIHPVYKFSPNKCSELPPALIFIDKGSVIRDVVGLGEAEGLRLDHIILQQNICKINEIKMGEQVYVYGHVGAYESGKKNGGYDYCIDKILNIYKWDDGHEK